MSKRKDRRTPRRDARDPYKEYPSWEDREKEIEAKPFQVSLKWALGATVIVLAVVALVGVASTGSVFFKGEAAEITNPAREKAIVFDPNRSLSTYEGFYDSCNAFNAAIIAASDASNEAKTREKTYSAKADPFGNERKAISGIRENARGLRNQARDLAAKYNADSSANTRAPFKAADLPYTLDPAGAEKAECGTSKEPGR